ncbi:MAG: hypothetical protein AAFO89_00620 [Planctomycetota bacterium]
MAGNSHNSPKFDESVFTTYSTIIKNATAQNATPEDVYKANRMCVVADIFAFKQESTGPSRSASELKALATWMLDNNRHTSDKDIRDDVKRYIKSPTTGDPGRSFELTFPHLASSVVQMILDAIVVDPGPRFREAQVDDG